MITGDIDQLAKKSKLNFKPVLSSTDNKKTQSKKSTKVKISQQEIQTSNKRIKDTTPQRNQQNEKSVNKKQSIDKDKEPNMLKLPIRNPPTKGPKKQSKRELVSQGKKNAVKKKQMYKLLLLMLKYKIDDGILISKLWAYNNIKFSFAVISIHINRFIAKRQFKILKESYLRLKDTKKYLKRAAFKTYTEKSKSNNKKSDKNKDISKFENDLIDYSDDPEILQQIEMEQKPIHPTKEVLEPQRKKEKINAKKESRGSLNLKESVNSKKQLKTSRQNLDPISKQQSKKSISKNTNSKEDVEKHLKELKKQPRKKKIKLPNKNVKQVKKENNKKDIVSLVQPKQKIQKNQNQKNHKPDNSNNQIEKIVEQYIKKKAKRKIFEKLFEIYISSHTINEEIEKMIKENKIRNILREWKYQTKKTFKTKIDLDFDKSQDEDLFSQQSLDENNDPKVQELQKSIA